MMTKNKKTHNPNSMSNDVNKLNLDNLIDKLGAENVEYKGNFSDDVSDVDDKPNT